MEPQCMKGCGWCGAFMCPAMTWLDCGQRFQCPFCDKLNEGKIEKGEAKAEPLKKKTNSWSPNLQSNLSVDANHQSCSNFTTLESKNFEFKFKFFCSTVPWQHYQPTNGVEGARVDRNKRPELSMGSYEILTSQQVQFT